MSSFSYSVPGVKQTTGNTCWLATAAMLFSWRDGKTYTELGVAKAAGKKFEDKLSNAEAIKYGELLEFSKSLGLKSGPMQCLSAQGTIDLLKKHGPIWIAGVLKSDGQTYGHIRLIVGVSAYSDSILRKILSDKISFMDPGNGQLHSMNYGAFMNQYEDAVIDQFNTAPSISNTLMFTLK